MTKSRLVLIASMVSAVGGVALLAAQAETSYSQETFNLALLKESESTYREFRIEQPPEVDEAVVIVIEQNLDEFLELAAKQNGYALKFSSGISGTLKNASLPLNMRKLLPRLENRFDLAWYMNDQEVYVSRASKKETREVSLEGLEVDELRYALRRSGIDAGEYVLAIEETRGVARLVGAPSHLDAIISLASQIKTQNGNK